MSAAAAFMARKYSVELPSPFHNTPPPASSPPSRLPDVLPGVLPDVSIKVMPPMEESTLHISPSAAPVHAPPTPSTPSVAIRLAGTALVLVAPQLDFFAGGNWPLSGAKQVLKVSGSFQSHCAPHVPWHPHVTFGPTLRHRAARSASSRTRPEVNRRVPRSAQPQGLSFSNWSTGSCPMALSWVPSPSCSQVVEVFDPKPSPPLTLLGPTLTFALPLLRPLQPPPPVPLPHHR